MKIFIDIETIPTQNTAWIKELEDGIQPPGNISKQETIDKWWLENGERAKKEAVEKTSFNGGMGQILCISCAVESCEINTFKCLDLSLEQEELILRAFNEAFIEEHYRFPHFIGHNVSFDLRFLYHRFVVHGIKPNFHLPYNEPPYKSVYTDTMELWAGSKGAVSLTNLCKYLNIPTSKEKMDGSQVWEYAQKGLFEEIAEYCSKDVNVVREIYKKLIFKNASEI